MVMNSTDSEICQSSLAMASITDSESDPEELKDVVENEADDPT